MQKIPDNYHFPLNKVLNLSLMNREDLPWENYILSGPTRLELDWLGHIVFLILMV